MLNNVVHIRLTISPIMYSIWTRAHAVFFASLTCLAVMCTLTSISTFLHVSSPVVQKLELQGVHSLRKYRDKTERSTLSFNLDAGNITHYTRITLFC